ncbi:MAG: universal stress protein [Chthoniobacterales bacterium]
MKTLLAPIDFSKSSPNVLQTTRQLATKLGAKVHLLNVREPTEGYIPIGASMDLATPPSMVVVDTDDKEILAQLEDAAKSLRENKIEVTYEVITGLAVEEILTQAKEKKIDYIILGSHGHGAIFHLFSGSVVTGVLKHAPCPVIVTPHHVEAN